jgi:HAD superfamily hydrolase (TIGR01662 family)
MGRYTEYFKEIWQLQANRKLLPITLFGVLYDNSTPFTPGTQLKIAEGTDQALKIIASKGYDFLVIAGQPPLRTKNLAQQDFENILNATREVMESVGAKLRNAYYAPGTDKTDPYVKPNTGMFERAQAEMGLNWEELVYVGAEINDVKAANKAKAKPVLIKSATTKTKAFELTHQTKIQEYNSLLDFANALG